MKLRRLSAPLQGVIGLLIVAGLAGSIACVPLWLSWRQHQRAQMRQEALPVTMHNAVPLIKAIQLYKQQHHSPPSSLQALVPAYLPHLPDAGPLAKSGWHYDSENEAEKGGWALFVWVRDEYSPNVFGFGDSFVFHPSGKFRRTDYGGGLLMTVGKWGYYVE